MIPDPDVQRQLILQEREKSRSRRAMAEAVAKETRERHRDTQWQRHLQRSYSKFDCTSKSESKAFKSHYLLQYIPQSCYTVSTYFHQENLQMKAEKIEQTKVRNEFALTSYPEYIVHH